jgi:hypothetical protein
MAGLSRATGFTLTDLHLQEMNISNNEDRINLQNTWSTLFYTPYAGLQSSIIKDVTSCYSSIVKYNIQAYIWCSKILV